VVAHLVGLVGALLVKTKMPSLVAGLLSGLGSWIQ
jgi:hypothetical protein